MGRCWRNPLRDCEPKSLSCSRIGHNEAALRSVRLPAKAAKMQCRPYFWDAAMWLQRLLLFLVATDGKLKLTDPFVGGLDTSVDTVACLWPEFAACQTILAHDVW